MRKPSAEKKKPVLDGAAATAIATLLLLRDEIATEAQVDKAQTELRKREEEEPALTLLDVLVEQGVLTEKKATDVQKKLDPEGLIPGYRILGEVGRGGMGTVFKARQLSMDRIVAVKVLSKKLSADERYVEKFLHEARAAGKLNHENIVSAIDCGAAEGIHYFVMEFVDGEEVMRVLMRDGPLPWEKAFEIAEQVGRALDHAHRHGLVHRDVKPENILWVKPKPEEPPGLKIKLCDLGLAKPVVQVETGEKAKTTEGTPYYASPEQALGRTDIDGRSDIYSLGATLYHFITGETPFDGENARQILWKQVHRPFPDLAEHLPEVPEGHRALLGQMVEKERDDRLATAQAFLEELAKLRAHALEAARPKPRAAAEAQPGAAIIAAAGSVAVLVVVLAIAVVVLRQNGNVKPPVAPSPVARTPEPPKPSPTSGPTLIRVEPSPEGDPTVVTQRPSPTPRPQPSGDEAENRAAQVVLDEATSYQEQNPDDISGYTARLRKVMQQYPGTQAALFAEKEMSALASMGLASFDKEFQKIAQKALELDAQGKWKDAIGVVDALCEKTDARLLAPRKADIEKFRTALGDHARARVDALVADALKKLGKFQPIDDSVAAIQALEAECPASVVKDAEAKIADLKKRALTAVGDGVLAEVTAHVEDLLAAGKLDDAKNAASALKDDQRVTTRADRVSSLLGELAQIELTWRTFDDRVRAVESAPKRVFKRRGSAGELDGQLKDYDSAAWAAKVKPFGRKDTVSLDFHDLVPEELVTLALPDGGSDVLKEGAAFALYFVARREPDAASITLDRLVLAGGADVPALRDRIARVRTREKDQRAQQLVDKALAANAVSYAADEVMASIKTLGERYADSRPYLDNLDELRKVYLAARTMRLASGDVAALFSGHLTRTRDVVKLEYDFAHDEGGVHDWLADTAISKDSAARFQKGRLLTHGKARNVAVWEGGSLSFDARIITPSGARPNVNLIVNDKGGWQGLICGFGFIYGGLTKIRIDPTAKAKNPGYLIPLPANVAYELEGRPPEQTGKCWSADQVPDAPAGRAVHYRVKRDAKGSLQGSVGSQVPIHLDQAPLWDQPGSCAIAGFETELGVETVVIEGRLDATWLADRARQIATAEALALPGPAPRPPAPPPTPPKPGGG